MCHEVIPHTTNIKIDISSHVQCTYLQIILVQKDFQFLKHDIMAFKIQFKLVIINNVHDCDKLILKSINQLFINEYPTGVIICKNHDSDPWNTQN